LPGGRHGRTLDCSQDPGWHPRQCSWRPCCSGSYSSDQSGSPPSVGEHSSIDRRPARELPRGGSAHPDPGEQCGGCERSKRHDHNGGSGGDAGRCRRRNGRWASHSWGKQSPPAKAKLATRSPKNVRDEGVGLWLGQDMRTRHVIQMACSHTTFRRAHTPSTPPRLKSRASAHCEKEFGSDLLSSAHE
jgi:hypothetical protein